MAIKKRTPVEQRALEEAFAAGADESQPEPSPHEQRGGQQVASSPSVAGDKAVSRKLLLRFPDDELPRLIEELAAEDGRSKHNLTLRALARGLQALKAERG